MALKLDWDRSSDGGSTTTIVGDTMARVGKAAFSKESSYTWEVSGEEDTREDAMEAAERAVLSTIAQRRNAPEWIETLLKMAHSGEAYLMVGGQRDMHSLFTIMRLAMTGAHGQEMVILERSGKKSSRKSREQA